MGSKKDREFAPQDILIGFQTLILWIIKVSLTVILWPVGEYYSC